MATIYVSPSGSNSNSGTSPSAAKATIAGAMTAASAGDTISVADGSYTGNFTTGKAGSSGLPITIKAANKHGATIVGEVLIAHQYIVLQDMVITGGSAVQFACDITANNTTVKGCKIFNVAKGTATSNGGSAIEIYSADGNYTAMSNILIDGNEIFDVGSGPGANQVVQGIYVSTAVTNGRVVNNLVYDVTDFGLHAFHSPSGWQYINNTVAGCGRGILTGPNFVTRNNISYNNLSANYDVRGTGNTLSNNISGGTGNVTGTGITAGVNPLFVRYAVDGTGDFRLQSGSPALNAGTAANAPATDLAGTARPQGSGVDIGCYETAVVTTPPPTSNPKAFPFIGFLDGVGYAAIPTGTTTVNVSTSAALSTALTNATAGQRIVLASGTYSGNFTLAGKNGTTTSGITIEAATQGGALFASGSTLVVNNSSYVTLKGLTFPYELTSGGNIIAFRGTSNRCRVTRCTFGPAALSTSTFTTKSTFVYMGDDTEHIRVDHNEIRNKTTPGNAVLGDGNFTTFQVVRHMRWDHNKVRGIKPEVSNEKEPFRLGVSTMSKTMSYSVIERNQFEDCIAEPEIVSVKAGGVRVSGNTVLRCIGGLVYRHGTDGLISDNYIVDRAATFGTTIGSGGFRFYDARHEISYNYVDGVFGGNFQGPLMLDSGDAEGSSTNLAGHWRVVSALVERNVLVGNPEGVRFGHNYSLAPTGCTVRDNIVASAATGVAITQRIAPVSTTIGTNPYYATPATGGLVQGSDTIWRKAGYGPRLTYLQSGDVGVTGDAADTDGTGTLISGGGTTPVDPGTATTAAEKFGWGTPLGLSDEFEYTGAPASTKWSVYDSAGHDGNGVRSPARVTVANGKMILTGLAGSANTAGVAHKISQQYGRWEVRCRSFYTSSPTTPGTLSGGYHPALIVWPTNDVWPGNGEYDLLENGEPGMQAADAFLHYPSLDGANHQIDVADFPVDLREFHNFAFEWTPDGLKGWVDGQPWFSHSGGAASDRKALQAMTEGQLTVQLDAFQATGLIASTMELEWVRVYSLTPTGPVTGPQTVTAVGIPTAQAFGVGFITGASPSRPPGSVDTRLGLNTVLGTVTLGYTQAGTTPPAPGPQTIFASGIPTALAFGVPALLVADGPQTVLAVGIASAAAFGIPQARHGQAPPPAPGGTLVPALYAVAADGHTLTPLPSWISIKISPVRNSAGSLEVVYSAGTPGFTHLHDNVSAAPLRALEVRVWLGGSQEGSLGGWLVQKSGDDLTPGSEWHFTGHFHEWLLTKALVYPQPISEANKNGELRFAGATAGLILGTAMDQAQGRGALPMVTRDFTATADSNGNSWVDSISSMKLAPGTTVSQVADKLVELGMCEYELTAARVWRAYNPGGRGVDRTAQSGESPLTFAHAVNLSEHSRRESSRDAGTAVLVTGAEGFYSSASSVTAQSQLGWRAEVGVSAGQLNSASAVAAVTPQYLQAAAAGVAEYAAAVEFGPGAAIPLIDYAVGDWAYTITGNTRRRLRIAQIELEFASGTPVTGKAVFNDLITDRLTQLYRRLNAISTGDAIVGTSESTPGGAGEDIIPPAAPTGVTVASTFAYQVPGETATFAEVGVGWAPVDTDAYADTETAGTARLAALLAARIRGGVSQAQVLASDWTFYGAPSWAATYAPLLKKAWTDDPAGKDADTGNAGPGALVVWLEAYELSHRGGGAIATDIDKYVVQYQYLGFDNTGATGGGTGAIDPIDPTASGTGFWTQPGNSPTSQTTLIFGDVEGGRALGVRVAAVDRSGNQGPWSQVVAIDTASDNTPPPAPSKPTVAPGFRLIRVTWDGKGSSGEDMVAAAPDILSGGGVEIHVAQGIDFTPDRPLGAGGKVDLALSTTYQATLYDAMTYPVTGLENGVTYYVRLVAVDRSGNASEVSATSDPVVPSKLVTIDYGPDTVDRATIRAAAIGSAEIDLLAVNEQHVGSVNASSITSGFMKADLTVSGRFATPVSATGNQIEFDSAGIRLRQGNTVVGRWQVADASMLVTGTYLSALSGERINILPDGSFRMYGAAGVDYASIENAGGIVRMRSRADAAGRRAYVDYDPTGFRAYYGTVGGQIRSLFYCEQTYSVMNAPVTGIRIYRHIPATDGTTPRHHFVTATASGDDSASIVHYERVALASNHAYLFGATSDAGIVFDAGFIGVTHNNISPADIHAASFVQVSAVAAKRDIAPVEFSGISARGIAQRARAKSYYYRSDFEKRPDKPDAWLQRFDEGGERLPDEQADWTAPQRPPVMHVGPMADDLLEIAPQIVHRDLPQRGPAESGLGLSMGTVAGLAYAGVGELGDEIDELRAELAELRKRIDPPPIVIDQESE